MRRVLFFGKSPSGFVSQALKSGLGGAGEWHHQQPHYHPLLLFNRDGDCLTAKLRSDNTR